MAEGETVAAKHPRVVQYGRISAVLLACAAFGALSSIAIARSGGSAASSAYYYYCPGGGAGGVYGYCPPTTTTTTTPNAAPNYTPPANQFSDEGETKSFNLGSFSDANNNGPWEVRVTWGDGSPAETFVVASEGALPNRTHTYAEDGTYTVTVRVEDAAGASDTDTFQVVVGNLPPTCGGIVAPIAPVPVGTAVTATAPFSDPGVQDTHTGSWNWGDGTSSAATIVEANGSGTASGTHTYTAPGVYTLTLTVTDDEGASGSCTFQFVVVFDPSAGFVTGGGWFESPPGAYTPDPTATGRATFGFVSKYKKGATVPDGNTVFQFVAGDLNFKSTSYEWLVIAGNKAMFKGSGTINGGGDYAFMVSAIDGSPDRFRIRIWDKVTGVVIYDNQAGAADTANPTTALGGGSITIHK
jgi:PKD repeat protein